MGLVSVGLGSTGVCHVPLGKPSVQHDLQQTGGLSWQHTSDASKRCTEQVCSCWSAHVYSADELQ